MYRQALAGGRDGKRRAPTAKAASFFERLIRHIRTLSDICNDLVPDSPVTKATKGYYPPPRLNQWAP